MATQLCFGSIEIFWNIHLKHSNKPWFERNMSISGCLQSLLASNGRKVSYVNNENCDLTYLYVFLYFTYFIKFDYPLFFANLCLSTLLVPTFTLHARYSILRRAKVRKQIKLKSNNIYIFIFLVITDLYQTKISLILV